MHPLAFRDNHAFFRLPGLHGPVQFVAGGSCRRAYIGQKLGEQWETNPTLKSFFHRFDFVIGILAVVAVSWWIRRHLRALRRAKHIREIHESGAPSQPSLHSANSELK